MARLVRATQDLRVADWVMAAPQTFLRHSVFMGRPDDPPVKPAEGDDDQKGND